MSDSQENGGGAGRQAPRSLSGPHRFAIVADTDIVIVRSKGRELALAFGFGPLDATLITAAISELSRNILVHAGTGEIVLEVRHDSPTALVITARDHGPGIPDIEMAMRDGYSTSGGLGIGLPGTRRVMDHLEIFTRAREGTVITAKKFFPR